MDKQAGSLPTSISGTVLRPSSAHGRRCIPPARSANIGQGHPGGSSAFPEFTRSTHPDAIRRRQQAEARRAAAQLDAETAQCCEWWEYSGPANFQSVPSPEALRNAIQEEGLVVIDFFAPWCMACRRLFPKLLQLAENNPDVLFLKVNGGDDALSKYVESLGVDRLPFFHFYKNGELLARFAANLTKINLLRAEIAAHKDCTEPACLL